MSMKEKDFNQTPIIHNSVESKPLLGKVLDIIYIILTIIVISGSFLVFEQNKILIKSYKEKNPSYEFYSFYDLIPSLFYAVLFYFLNKFYTKYLTDFLAKTIEIKPNMDTNEFNKIKSKHASNIFKFVYYTLITIFGYEIFKDVEFFPYQLGGSGEWKLLFSKGLDNVIYWNRPNYLSLYYNINLGWCLFDVYHLLTSPLQSDFNMMVLHHTVTISLVAFSFVSNYSNFGIVIFYLHYIGDSVVYIVRFFLPSIFPAFLKLFSTFILAVFYFYTRIYVYGLVLSVASVEYAYKEWNIVDHYLFKINFCLYFLHLIWEFLIVKKILSYFIFAGKIEDVSHIKGPKKTH